MAKPQAIGIYRETKLAGKPGADQLILDYTAKDLEKRGFNIVTMFSEDFLEKDIGDKQIDLVFTMARDVDINDYLSLIKEKRNNILMLNSPVAIRASFNRVLTFNQISQEGVYVPSVRVFNVDEIKFSDLKGKVILKPAYRHEYWFVIEKEFHFKSALRTYKELAIEKIIVQNFIKGEDLKFYSIGEELILPKNHWQVYPQETIEKIKYTLKIIKETIGLKIFGGDFVIDVNDNYKPYCVDINDWPSFSAVEGLTQEEAAEKIANLIEKEYNAYRKS